jgi:ELWxxDGT repeat protein
MVLDINRITANSAEGPSFLDINGTTFFGANDGVDAGQLWKSDGTAAGTVMLTNVHYKYGRGLSALFSCGRIA